MRLIRWTRRHVILTLVAVVALAASGIAVAQQRQNGPRTDRVDATFTLNRDQVSSRVCQGNDGLYTEQHATYRGTALSQDPRLNGELTVRTDTLVNQADTTSGKDFGRLQGTAEGHFRLEADNGTVTTGNFIATVTGRDEAGNFVVRTEGITDGQVRGPAHEVGGKIIGSFTTESDRTGQVVVGEFGGSDDDAEQPAYIQTESCTGPGNQPLR